MVIFLETTNSTLASCIRGAFIIQHGAMPFLRIQNRFVGKLLAWSLWRVVLLFFLGGFKDSLNRSSLFGILKIISFRFLLILFFSAKFYLPSFLFTMYQSGVYADSNPPSRLKEALPIIYLIFSPLESIHLVIKNLMNYTNAKFFFLYLTSPKKKNFSISKLYK